MADLSSFGKAKDWAIVALIGIVGTLLGMIATANRGRIESLETARSVLVERVVRLEQQVVSQQREIDRLERKRQEVAERWSNVGDRGRERSDSGDR